MTASAPQKCPLQNESLSSSMQQNISVSRINRNGQNWGKNQTDKLETASVIFYLYFILFYFIGSMQFRLALCFYALAVQVDCMFKTLLQLLEIIYHQCLDSIKSAIL